MYELRVDIRPFPLNQMYTPISRKLKTGKTIGQLIWSRDYKEFRNKFLVKALKNRKKLREYLKDFDSSKECIYIKLDLGIVGMLNSDGYMSKTGIDVDNTPKPIIDALFEVISDKSLNDAFIKGCYVEKYDSEEDYVNIMIKRERVEQWDQKKR